jgi:hypothetical protein
MRGMIIRAVIAGLLSGAVATFVTGSYEVKFFFKIALAAGIVFGFEASRRLASKGQAVRESAVGGVAYGAAFALASTAVVLLTDTFIVRGLLDLDNPPFIPSVVGSVLIHSAGAAISGSLIALLLTNPKPAPETVSAE